MATRHTILQACHMWVLLQICLSMPNALNAQTVQWAKVYPLAKEDKICCVTRDEEFIYAGGYTYRNAFYFNTTPFYKAIVVKLDTLGDTLYIKDLGVSGEVMSIAMDPYGMIRANVKQYYYGVNGYNTFLFTIHPEGFILHTDTIEGYAPTACIIGKDSSLIMVGHKNRLGFPGQTSMYFRRVTKQGIVEPWKELNPGHSDCRANRVEQLPNGHYLVSGYVGSRVASYELKNPDGSDSVFHQWYQTPDFTNMESGHVGRLGKKNWMVAGSGAPDFVAAYDSTKSKIWIRKEQGVQQPPQSMVDGSMVFGYSLLVWPLQYFARLNSDSSQQWFFNMRDSLNARGILGSLKINSFAYFEDESAVFAGQINQDDGIPPDTEDDPIFLRIANVGTPVTSLIKPQKGPLANETLAPWPNPTGGTLYLKQHFDKAEIHLYNLSGKEMGEYRIGFAQPIDISGYNSGVYLYRAVIDGKFYSGKIIRN